MIQKKKICGGCNSEQYIWKNVNGVKLCRMCANKQKELKSSTEAKPKNKTKWIAVRSPKRSAEEKIYAGKRIIFLNRNPICRMKIPGLCTTHATEVQHLKGRTGDLYLDERYWLPGCHNCHAYATDHPQEAIEKGWALPRLSDVRIDSKGRKIMGLSPDRTCLDCQIGFSLELLNKDGASPCCGNFNHVAALWQDDIAETK